MPERHVISVTEDLDLVAVHHPAPTDDWLVFCHGLRSDKSGSYEERSEVAVDAGCNAVRFDFRGCGESEGSFRDGHLSGRIADLEAVLAYFEPSSAVLFGSSFGGAVAFHVAAADDRVEAVATRAPVTYTEQFLAADERSDRARREELGEAFVEDVASHAFEDVVAELDVPVAIVHGGADDSVPIEHSFRAAEALSTDVLLQKYEDEGHRFSAEGENRLRRLLVEWLAGV
jgi:pimeloyl-ACP methyl ester carboxylesterase